MEGSPSLLVLEVDEYGMVPCDAIHLLRFGRPCSELSCFCAREYQDDFRVRGVFASRDRSSGDIPRAPPRLLFGFVPHLRPLPDLPDLNDLAGSPTSGPGFVSISRGGVVHMQGTMRRCECGAIDGMGVSAKVRRPSRSLRARPAPRQPHSKLRDPATRRCLRVHATASRFLIRPMRDGAAAQQVWWRAAEGALDEKELDTFLLYRVGAVGGARPTPRPSPALRLNLDDDLLQRALRDAKRCWVCEEGA
ncbi:hypothetical protein B0H10DRAFT_2223493 [Mycena sp. CBHHK59/15]|nr:hypothetical protein B0H10DRAFT_2223493 [Mycena sp. CBHHK59/15]